MSLIRAALGTVAAALVLGTLTPFAGAQCGTWDPAFRTGGMDDVVVRTAMYDDGMGPALYAVGSFHEASGGPARSIARWDGAHWNALPTSANAPNAELDALHVWDDGTGPALYVGGQGTVIGNVSFSVFKWNGIAWSPVSGGPAYGVKVIEDFQGWLYVGGTFTAVGSQFQPGITRWNGSVWGGIAGVLGSSGDNGVYDMQIFDDGTGPALYAAGSFSHAGLVYSPGVARWNGSDWSAVGGIYTTVAALNVFDAGAGPELVVAGPPNAWSPGHVQRLHAGSWLPVGGELGLSGQLNAVNDLIVHDDGSGGGPKLYVAGRFTVAGSVSARNVARLDGGSWAALGTGLSETVRELNVFDAGNGPRLLAFGEFTQVGGFVARRAAQWDGAQWSALEPNNSVPDGGVEALAHFDDGHGDALFAAGTFLAAGNVAARSIARWDGATWWNIQSGITGHVQTLAVHDDGGGAQLYVGGVFDQIDGVFARGIARWNGTSWTGLDVPNTLELNGAWIDTLASFDDGSGPTLYVGGQMQWVSNVEQGVASWRNGVWSTLGAGLQGVVFATAVHNDGGGPRLYAGGTFATSGGAPVANLAQWDGTTWSSVGGGMQGAVNATRVRALVSFDDGTGPALFAGGSFTSAGGTAVSNVARFKDGAWSALGSGTSGEVFALAVHDDGSGHGPVLYAGGSFTSAGGTAAGGIARWDGSVWTAVATGVGNYDASVPTVRALTVWNHGPGRDLYAGGTFHAAGGTPSQNFARFDGCGETGRTFCYGDGSGAACPCGNASAPGDRAGCMHSFGYGATLRAGGEPSLSGDSLVLHGASMTNSAVLYFQGFGEVAGGAGAPFGDGLRCLTGPFIRMATKTNIAGASDYPVGADVSLSTRGAIFAPGKRTYQARYRNSAAFCTPETFNYTNALEILWIP